MLFTKLILCTSMLLLAGTSDDGTPSSDQGKKTLSTAQIADETQPDVTDSPEPEEIEVDGVRLIPIEANLVSQTNAERARYGLPAAEVDKDLMNSAREHATWMTRNRSMVHTRRPVAENIAMGQPSSNDAVRAWMRSPGHRANILNPGHLRIGVAAYRTESGTIYWCQQFRR